MTYHLIGMLDSPFVRRVAVTMQLFGLPYKHTSISVFRNFDQFKELSPVVKAPSLVCEDGSVLLESPQIIDYLEAVAGKSLMPTGLDARRRANMRIGLALVACEKVLQTVVELKQRPEDKQHAPWLGRVKGQLETALSELERDIVARPFGDTLDQASLTTAIAWRFIQFYFAETITAERFPALAAHSRWAETQPAFQATQPPIP